MIGKKLMVCEFGMKMFAISLTGPHICKRCVDKVKTAIPSIFHNSSMTALQSCQHLSLSLHPNKKWYEQGILKHMIQIPALTENKNQILLVVDKLFN